jgi:hypothetical protein
MGTTAQVRYQKQEQGKNLRGRGRGSFRKTETDGESPLLDDPHEVETSKEEGEKEYELQGQ